MKKVGIITMHKVRNYGSALQAYALQEVIRSMGYEVELIDYLFPNEYHKSLRPKESFFTKILLFLVQLFYCFPQVKRDKIFSNFYKKFFCLSPIQYKSKIEIDKNPPQYDIYVTGSDQVWNSKYIGNDTTFMLSFTNSKAKISYSSSFASEVVDVKYKELYANYLSNYSALAVREQNGRKIIREILNRDSSVVLDPTLLLSQKDYDKLSMQSNIEINEPYILAYILGYSFNPYPYIETLINHIQSKLKMKVYLLSVSNTKMLFKSNSKRLQKVGPCEFVSLFKNSSFVITTSFHGTAFAINYQKPFYSLIEKNKDDRLLSLLELLKLKDRALYNNSTLPEIISFKYTKEHINLLDSLKQDSFNYLRDSLSKYN